MRGVRFTKAERELIATWATNVVDSDKTKAVAASVLAKIAEAVALPGNRPGVAAGPLEAAMIEGSQGKIVGVGSNAYPRISRQATALGATVQDAHKLGVWIAGQKWLTGPLTIFTVLNKWPDWMARAKATAAPDGFEEGLGATNLGQSPAAKRPATTAGRRAPGIG